MLVSAMHITAGVWVNDDEPGIQEDALEWLDKLAPPSWRPPAAEVSRELLPDGGDYRHHRGGEDNGDAHLKNMICHHQVIVPITAGRPRPRPVAGDLLRRVRRPARQAARDQGDGRMSERDAPEALEQAIGRYNDAWNAHDLDAIMAMHAPDMVFENHTAGERAVGEEAREHIGKIFHTWPDLEFSTRRLYVRDGLVVQEWTATATHANRMQRGEVVAEPTGRRCPGTAWTSSRSRTAW